MRINNAFRLLRIATHCFIIRRKAFDYLRSNWIQFCSVETFLANSMLKLYISRSSVLIYASFYLNNVLHLTDIYICTYLKIVKFIIDIKHIQYVNRYIILWEHNPIIGAKHQSIAKTIYKLACIGTYIWPDLFSWKQVRADHCWAGQVLNEWIAVRLDPFLYTARRLI